MAMSYMNSLFGYEDTSSWTHTISKACSTIVSYGVEIPWCVCHQSIPYINQVFESFQTFLTILGVDKAWTTECTWLLILCMFNIPILCGIKKNAGTALLLKMISVIGIFFCFVGSIIQLTNALVDSGPMAFGGRLVFPAALVFSLVTQFAAIAVTQLRNFIFIVNKGVGEKLCGGDEACKFIKLMMKKLPIAASVIHAASVCIAVFGLPAIFDTTTEECDWKTFLPVILVLTYFHSAKNLYFTAVNNVVCCSGDEKARKTCCEDKDNETTDSTKDKSQGDRTCQSTSKDKNCCKYVKYVCCSAKCLALCFCRTQVSFCSLPWFHILSTYGARMALAFAYFDLSGRDALFTSIVYALAVGVFMPQMNCGPFKRWVATKLCGKQTEVTNGGGCCNDLFSVAKYFFVLIAMTCQYYMYKTYA